MNFREIFTKDRQKVKNIIKLVTKEENEDLEQEVFLKAYKNKEKYHERGKFTNWITTITYNVSRDYLKSGKKRYEAPVEDENVVINIRDRKRNPEEASLQRERQMRITAAINALNKKHKEVIILSEIENMSYEDISKKLRCPLGTVKSRIYNAKKELFNILKDLIQD